MRTIAEIHQVMVDCLDIDNLEASKIRCQHLLTPEEQQAMRDFNDHYNKRIAETLKACKVGMISEAECFQREHDLLKEKMEKLQGKE